MGNLIAKIVLTGGPCAGKTTTISRIEEHLREKGYHVLVLNECATEMIKAGIRPFGVNLATVYDFENEVLNLQLYKEKRYNNFLEKYDDNTKIVILYDRGTVDVKAYLGEENYNKMLKENNLRHENLLKEYDMVIHMITVAADMENRYSNSNNTARFEDSKEAIDLDKRTNEAWKEHANLKVVPVCEFLEDKIKLAINYVDELLEIKDKTSEEGCFVMKKTNY